MSLTEITGEVSVKPYPSITGISAAAKILAKRGCNAALPETIKSRFPPKPSFHLLKINFLAIFSWNSYHDPFAP